MKNNSLLTLILALFIYFNLHAQELPSVFQTVLIREPDQLKSAIVTGKDVDKAVNGLTPLMLAILQGNEECFDQLVEAGARFDLSTLDLYKNSIKSHHPDVIKYNNLLHYLYIYYPPNEVTRNLSALQIESWLVKANLTELTPGIVDSLNVDLTVIDIHRLMSQYKNSVFKEDLSLLGSKIDGLLAENTMGRKNISNKIDKLEKSFIDAIIYSREEDFKVLYSKHHLPFTQGLYGKESPAARACSECNNKLLTYMVDNDLDVNTKNYEGKHDLLYFSLKEYQYSKTKCFETIETLVREGADINYTDLENHNAVATAIIEEYESVIDLLLKKGIEKKSRFAYLAATAYGNETQMQILKKILAQQFASDSLFWALFGTVKMGKIPQMKLLLEAGANPDQRLGMDFYGKTGIKNFTVLNYAITEVYYPNTNTDVLETVRTLVENGADITRTNGAEGSMGGIHSKDCLSTLYYALRYMKNNDEKRSLIKYLLDQGADPHKIVPKTSPKGKTCGCGNGNAMNALLNGPSENLPPFIDLLLEKGVKFDLVDASGATPYDRIKYHVKPKYPNDPKRPELKPYLKTLKSQ